MLDANPTDRYLRINEIKNHIYCSRIPYYTLCLGIDRETDLSRGGILEEQDTKQRMKRRKHALHAVHDGTRHFDVLLVSHQFGLIGRLDEMVETAEGVYLVDYKDTERDFGYWRLQTLAYHLAAEEAGFNVIGCYVYLIPKQEYKPIQFKSKDVSKLTRVLDTLWDMVDSETCPPPVAQIGKCRSCQYARFCNDVF